MDDIITKEEFNNQKQEKARLKLEQAKSLLLARANSELKRGAQHMLGVPDNEEAIQYVIDTLGQAGWKVEVRRTMSKYTNVRSGTEYEKVNVTLHFS